MNNLDRLKDIDMRLYRITIDMGEHIPQDAEYTELWNLWEKLLDLEYTIDNELRHVQRLLDGKEV